MLAQARLLVKISSKLLNSFNLTTNQVFGGNLISPAWRVTLPGRNFAIQDKQPGKRQQNEQEIYCNTRILRALKLRGPSRPCGG
jgi:hypothetical protein